MLFNIVNFITNNKWSRLFICGIIIALIASPPIDAQRSSRGQKARKPAKHAQGVKQALGQPQQAKSSQKKRKNVVLIISDDQDFRSLDRMPYLGSNNGWFKFTNAFVNTPMCCPSRATILTGKNSIKTGVTNNPYSARFDDRNTIATQLQGAGYRTGLFGKYFNFYPWGRGDKYIPPGWNQWMAFKNQAAYYNYTLNQNKKLTRYGNQPKDYSTDVLKKKTIEFIEESSKKKSPFFAYYAPFAPHGPRTVAKRYEAKVNNHPTIPVYPNFNEADLTDKPSWVQNLPKASKQKEQGELKAQYGSLLALDEAIKEIVTSLKKSNQLDDTVIIFLSDNGYSYGSHRYKGKPCAYDECSKVPMRILYPGIRGSDVSSLASNMDIAPTIANIAGISGDIYDGQSLIPALLGNTNHKPIELFAEDRNDDGLIVSGYYGVRISRFKYVEYFSGDKELYDSVTDPYEMNNLANKPGYEYFLAYMHQQMLTAFND